MTAAKKKIGYEEIKQYVLEKFGMKVSHLYITQEKRKCGIIERQNYNKLKSEDARQLQYLPDNEYITRPLCSCHKYIKQVKMPHTIYMKKVIKFEL